MEGRRTLCNGRNARRKKSENGHHPDRQSCVCKYCTANLTCAPAPFWSLMTGSCPAAHVASEQQESKAPHRAFPNDEMRCRAKPRQGKA